MSKSVAPSAVLDLGAILSILPSTFASGRAPILMWAGIPSRSLPTSISSTVPLKMRVLMSARLVSAVPAW